MENMAKNLISQALELSAKERALMAEQLLLSLENPSQDIDKAWGQEAEARINALEQGKLKKVPVESVLGKTTL